MTNSQEPKQVTNNDLPNSQFGGGFINAENVNAGRIGGDIYNIHLEPLSQNIKIDWHEICIAMLESQQEAARFRRKATEKGFEINVDVPWGLVERKQQQRRQLNEYRDRENVYGLSEEVIAKAYDNSTFLREVIAQQPANNKHIAIIGEPGAGKSTLLSIIASFIKDETQDLPIIIFLTNLQGRTIEEYLLKQWLTEAMKAAKHYVVVTSEIERQFIEYFAKGRVWLLLDGVDEIGENSPVQALAKINQELTASLRQARVLLTCRLNVWDSRISNPLIGFDIYKNQEFKQEQIDDFIQQWFEHANNLQKGKILQAKLKETKYENIRKLVTNPLRLSLLCQVFDLDKQEKFPETKVELYQRFTRYLYEWKSELFPELYQSEKLKNELHQALSKLAFAGIDTEARFRLTKKLAHQHMGEILFQLARDSFWLILVERADENDEEVYAFFHPNFQEYFAALSVKDWHRDFFHHLPDNPAQGTYRIFEPQWEEVILLWLGREDVDSEEKEAFLKALLDFDDGCENRTFYSFQRLYILEDGLKEFSESRLNDAVKYGINEYGDFEYERYLYTLPSYQSALVYPDSNDIFDYIDLFQWLNIVKTKDEAWQLLFNYSFGSNNIDILERLKNKIKFDYKSTHELIISLKKLLNNNNNSIRLAVVESLKQLINTKKILNEDFPLIINQFRECTEIIQHCCKNMSYPNFYNAWHQVNNECEKINNPSC